MDDVGLKAERLLAEFGSLASVVAASPARQSKPLGHDATAVERIGSFRAAMIHLLRSDMADRPLLAQRDRLESYLHASLAFTPVEQLRALHLDGAHRLIADDLIGHGTPRHVRASPRIVLARSLEVEAVSLILVHNHPGGSLVPSADDLAFTRRIAELAEGLEIDLVDHIIVAAEGSFSFAKAGLLA